MANFNSMQEVINHLRDLPTLSALEPKDYALEEGMADTIAGKKGEMKFTQIRKFFGHIKKIETVELKGKKDTDLFDSTKFYPLMPGLAYSYGRSLITRDFYDVMKICLASNKIKTVADFKRFIELLTAVIAYHKKSEAEKKGGGH